MVKVVLFDANGARREIEGRVGFSLMEAAVDADVAGIDADCRGACACATCHVHVDDAWFPKVGEPNELEKDMFGLAENLGPTSRLSCQIRLKPELEGLVARVPR